MHSTCPGNIERLLLLLGELPPSQKARLERHVPECSRCAEEIASLERTVMALRSHDVSSPEAATACLDEAEIGAWVDDTLDPGATGRVLSHLAACPRCRRAAASLAQALKQDVIATALTEIEGKRRDRRVTLAPAGLAARLTTKRFVARAAVAAAAVVAGLVFLRSIDRGVEQPPAHRESAPTVVSAPELEDPIGAVAAIEEFRWSAVRGADRYKLTIFDEQGSVIWELETQETSVAPPATIELEPGVQYLWKIAARLRLGRWVGSDLVTFTISEP